MEPIFERVMSKEAAKELLRSIEQLDDAYFVDRSKFAPNISLDSTRNKYLSMSDASMPSDTLFTLQELFKETPVEEFLVNRYYEGMSIGPHKDANLVNYSSVLFLEDDVQVLSVVIDGKWVKVPDESGTMITFGIDTVHKVDPVNKVRHSIIILRDRI